MVFNIDGSKSLWERVHGFMKTYQTQLTDDQMMGERREDVVNIISGGAMYHLCMKIKEHGAYSPSAVEGSHVKYVLHIVSTVLAKFIFEGIELRPTIPVNFDEDRSYHIQFRCRMDAYKPIEIFPSEAIIEHRMSKWMQKIYFIISKCGDDGVTKTQLTHAARTINSSVRQNIIDILISENKVRVEVSQPYRKKKFTYYAT